MEKKSTEVTFWGGLLGNTSAAKRADNVKLTKLIDLARGSRSLVMFAYDCGISPGVMYRTANGTRIRPMMYQHICSIAEHADPGSGVTLELLLAANGMYAKRFLYDAKENLLRSEEKVLELPEPAKSSLYTYCKRETENGTPDNGKTVCAIAENITEGLPCSEGGSRSYPDFIKDLAYYAAGLSVEEKKALHKKKDAIFLSKQTVALLAEYREEREHALMERQAYLKSYFLSGKRSKRVPPVNMDEKRDAIGLLIQKL